MDLPVHYKNIRLGLHYRAAFVCYRGILVELEARDRLGQADASQIINCLAASRITRGLLLNFGSPSLRFRRFVGPGAPAIPSAQSV